MKLLNIILFSLCSFIFCPPETVEQDVGTSEIHPQTTFWDVFFTRENGQIEYHENVDPRRYAHSALRNPDSVLFIKKKYNGRDIQVSVPSEAAACGVECVKCSSRCCFALSVTSAALCCTFDVYMAYTALVTKSHATLAFALGALKESLPCAVGCYLGAEVCQRFRAKIDQNYTHSVARAIPIARRRLKIFSRNELTLPVEKINFLRLNSETRLFDEDEEINRYLPGSQLHNGDRLVLEIEKQKFADILQEFSKTGMIMRMPAPQRNSQYHAWLIKIFGADAVQKYFRFLGIPS